MFAVVKTGGKQYKVKSGDVIRVEKLAGNPGDVIVLDQVLAIVDGATKQLAASAVSKAKVSAEIIKQGKGDKVLVFKKKRRHNYKRTQGHRQIETTLKIGEISLAGNVTARQSAVKPEAKKETQKPSAEKKSAKPAAKKESAKKTEGAVKPKKPAAKVKKGE